MLIRSGLLDITVLCFLVIDDSVYLMVDLRVEDHHFYVIGLCVWLQEIQDYKNYIISTVIM